MQQEISEELLQHLPKDLTNIAFSYLEVGLHCCRQWGLRGKDLRNPTKVLTLPSGKIAVVDGHQIILYTKKGEYISLWEQSGSHAGIRHVALLPSEREIATVSNSSIKILDLHGHVQRSWEPELFIITAITSFALPSGESVIAVTDFDSRVEIYAIDGKLLHRWGSPGNEEGEFDCPSGIVYLSSSEEVAVADSDRIQFFSLRPGNEGKFVRQWKLPDKSEDIALFPGNRLMVIYRDCIRVFSLEGECIHCWTHHDQHKISSLGGVAMIGNNKMAIVDLQGDFRVKILRIQTV